MHFNFAKDKNPVAVWFRRDGKCLSFRPSDLLTLTYGAEELAAFANIHHIPLNKIPIEWRRGEQVLQPFGIKKTFTINDFQCRDALFSLIMSLGFNPLEMTSYQSVENAEGFTVSGQVEYLNGSGKRLFFNAPKKYRESIMRGKFPVRSTQHYRARRDHSSDKAEAMTSVERLNEKIFNSMNSQFISKLPYDSHVICAHTNPRGLPEFGGDLYEIECPLEFLAYIGSEIDEYWNSLCVDYVGSFAHAKLISYSKEVEMLDNPCINIIYRGASEGGILQSLENSIFKKPLSYSEEQEFRIAIIPCYSNTEGNGVAFSNPKALMSFANSDEFMCRGKSMEKTIRLIADS